jgi:hypothetical protein
MMVVKPTDDGMVVFPMANGKLATTWVQNVDAILSEGTGDMSLNRLKTLKGKLTNALSLLEHRLNEIEQAVEEKKAKDFIASKIKYVSEHCLGKHIHVEFGGGQISVNGILTYAAIEGDKLHIQGLYPLALQRNSKAYLTYMHSSIGQIEYKVPVKCIHVREIDDTHFIISTTVAPTTIEFSESFSDDCRTQIQTYLTEINEQFHAITAKPTPKKVKLVLKKHTPKAKTGSK